MTLMARRLGTGQAVVVGLGAMLGAGVFSAFAPAARAAGGGLVLAVLLAAAVAACNAASTARLAAEHPQSGGAYLYGRRRLGPVPGFVAGWSFVVGKTASCAAMALTAGSYAWPEHARAVALVASVVLTVVDASGVTRTARVTAVLVGGTVLALAVAVAGARPAAELLPAPAATLGGVLQASGLMFFAFAGYARVATLGEEVLDPRRTIPRAVAVALGVVTLVYLVVALALLGGLGPGRLAASGAPVLDLVRAGRVPGLAPVVRVGATAACLGVLLSLLAGVSRTVLAMARDGELPHPLARLGSSDVPVRAQVLVGLVVVGVVAVADVRGAIGFSSAGVLLYYLVANASAWTLRGRARAVAAVGTAGCVVLVATLPTSSVLGGVAVVAAGLALRGLRRSFFAP